LKWRVLIKIYGRDGASYDLKLLARGKGRTDPERDKSMNEKVPDKSNYFTKRYYRVDEIAVYFAISVRTVYRLINDGDLMGAKIRGCLRV
jgi:excisionase family DNA binding protein